MSFEDILENVKAHPELWRPTHKFYKQKTYQTKAWEKMASELNIDAKMLKTRWKYLKDQYRKEMKKIKAKEIESSRWLYFDKLEFLTEELLSEGKRNITQHKEQDNDEAEPPKKVAKIPESSSSKDNLFIMSKLTEINEKIDTQSNEELINDPDYMFLMSVLPTIRNLSEVQKFVFRGKINQWLLEALTQAQSEYPEPYESKYIVDS